jgi:hypothetical protein
LLIKKYRKIPTALAAMLSLSISIKKLESIL